MKKTKKATHRITTFYLESEVLDSLKSRHVDINRLINNTLKKELKRLIKRETKKRELDL